MLRRSPGALQGLCRGKGPALCPASLACIASDSSTASSTSMRELGLIMPTCRQCAQSIALKRQSIITLSETSASCGSPWRSHKFANLTSCAACTRIGTQGSSIQLCNTTIHRNTHLTDMQHISVRDPPWQGFCFLRWHNRLWIQQTVSCRPN